MPAPSSLDLRRHPRFEILASVEIHRDGETLILPARNLSLGGIYLSSDGNDLSLFQIGTPVEVLVFDANDESRPPVLATASVVRREKDGMALSFKADAQLSARLGELINSISPTPID